MDQVRTDLSHEAVMKVLVRGCVASPHSSPSSWASINTCEEEQYYDAFGLLPR